MGYGAYINITNNRSNAMRTFVTDVNCMYENGADGSHLEYFNNKVIAASSTYPGGKGVYTEAKGSGSCWFDNSTFSIKVTDDTNGAIIGTVAFTDSDENWDISSNTNRDVLNVNIDNSGSQATITIIIAAS
jgi:hypothetical protein